MGGGSEPDAALPAPGQPDVPSSEGDAGTPDLSPGDAPDPSPRDAGELLLDAIRPAVDPMDVDADGVVYALRRDRSELVRWDSETESKLEPVALGRDGESALSMAVSESGRLYIGYANGEIRWFDTHAWTGGDALFATLAHPVTGLSVIGDRLLAVDASTSGVSHHLLDPSGGEQARATLPFAAFQPLYAVAGTYDATRQRYYFFCQGVGEPTLCAEPLDVQAGFGALTVSPDRGRVAAPIRVTPDHERVLLGSGVRYAADTLAADDRAFSNSYDSLRGQVFDVQLLSDGSALALENASNCCKGDDRVTSWLYWLNRIGRVLGSQSYPGPPLRIFPVPRGYVVVTDTPQSLADTSNAPFFDLYQPNFDRDGDGVLNEQDAFPNDPAAALDTDNDGAPDAWNPGYGAADTTLSLDAYPTNAGCQLLEQGDGEHCNVVPPSSWGAPNQIEIDGQGIVYISLFGVIWRWDARQDRYLAPIRSRAGTGVGDLIYSKERQRMYLGTVDDRLLALDPASDLPLPSEFDFEIPGQAVAVAGDRLVVLSNVLREEQSIFDTSGQRLSRAPTTGAAPPYTYEATLGRVFYGLNNSNGVGYTDLEPQSGLILGSGIWPYAEPMDGLGRLPRLRSSADGQRLLVDSEIHGAQDLRWQARVAARIGDAQWLADGGLVFVRLPPDSYDRAAPLLERIDPAGAVVERVVFDGSVMRLLPLDGGFLVAMNIDNNLQFDFYTPSDDRDGDGVANALDAFERDPAASLDTDHDGAPDAWNPGADEQDSTTGLALDAFPNDSACTLPEQGTGEVCDIPASSGMFDHNHVVVDSRGIVYLLDSAGLRIYRWDSTTEQAMNPLVLGRDPETDLPAPGLMVYAPEQDRLYLTDSDGLIRYLELAEAFPVQRPFSFVGPIHGLASAGEHLFVDNDFFGAPTQFVLDAAGTIRDQSSLPLDYVDQGSFAYQADMGRLYFRSYGLGYADIDPVTGAIVDSRTFGVLGYSVPMRLSPDGTRMVFGDGNILRMDDFQLDRQLDNGYFRDAQWLPDGGLVTVSSDLLKRWDAAGALVDSFAFSGDPVALFRIGSRLLIVTSYGQFTFYDPN